MIRNLLLLCCLVPCALHAQKKTIHKPQQQNVFVKNQMRRITVADTTAYHLFSNPQLKLYQPSNLSIAELMLTGVLKGSKHIYNNKDCTPSSALNMTQAKHILQPQPDTVEIEDPVTGKILTRVVERHFCYECVYRFDLLEQWTCNIDAGTTDVHIKSVGLIKEMYGDDGMYYGPVVVFWMKYADVEDALQEYYRQCPVCNFSTSLWTSYFTEPYADGRYHH